MHKCSVCKKECGGTDKPTVYQFKGEDYCTDCMRHTAPHWKIAIDKAVSESKIFLKRYATGTYMKPREDANGYGKKL